jgi:hypothetical protein
MPPLTKGDFVRNTVSKACRLGTALALSGLALGLTATGASATVNAATLSVTNGDLTTPVQLSIPAGAGCANATTTAASFMVPFGTNVQNLTFSGSPPTPNAPAINGLYLPLANSSPALTGNASSNTSNGTDFPLPKPLMNNTFEFDGLFGTANPAGAHLPVSGTTSTSNPFVLLDTNAAPNTGRWLVGIACEVSGSANPPAGPEMVFSVEVDFTASGNGATWTVPSSGGPVVPEAPLAIGLPIGGAAVFGVAVFVNRRRRSPSGPVVTR